MSDAAHGWRAAWSKESGEISRKFCTAGYSRIRRSMANLAFHVDFWESIIANEQEGEDEALSSSLAWYSEIFMIAVHSKDLEKMEGFCDACMLVLDSIVDDDSTLRFQSMLLSFLVHTKEHLPLNSFSNMRNQASKLIKLLSWLIKEALSSNGDARLLLDNMLEFEIVCEQNKVDVLFFQTCVVLAVETMVGLDQNVESNRSIENADKKLGLLQIKLVVLKSIFNACIQCVEASPEKQQINFQALGISRESNLNSLDCIIKHLTENIAASFRGEQTASREIIPAFSLFGEIIDFLSKALKVYQLQRSQDRTHIHFVYSLVIMLLEISSKMNSVTFMGHAALVCKEQLLHILDDSQKQNISNAMLEFLSPKLQQLQAGKFSGLNYEAVISIALKLMPPFSKCTGLHQMVKATALLMCNREEKIP